MDIYRLIGGLGLLTFAWVAQIVGLVTFRQECEHGPPKVNVMDFDQFMATGGNRTLGDLARERGWDVSRTWVSSAEAERMNAKHLKRQWLGLAVGLTGVLATVLLGWRLWDSWRLGLLAVVLGPAVGGLVGYLNRPAE